MKVSGKREMNSPFSVKREVKAAEDFQILSLQPLILQLSGYCHTVLIVDDTLTVQQHISIQPTQRLGHHHLTCRENKPEMLTCCF